jgi:hypothetical protein
MQPSAREILVVQSAENRFRDDAMTITNLMAAGHPCG